MQLRSVAAPGITAPPVYRPQVASTQRRSDLRTGVAAFVAIQPRRLHPAGGTAVVQRMEMDDDQRMEMDDDQRMEMDDDQRFGGYLFSSPLFPSFRGGDLLSDLFPAISDTTWEKVFSGDSTVPIYQQEPWASLSYGEEFQEDIRKFLESLPGSTTSQPTSSNPYEWRVKSINSFQVSNPDVLSVLTSFGDPITDVVKIYQELGGRVRHDVEHNKGVLQVETSRDIELYLEASTPLHFEFNPYLHKTWSGNLTNYGGSKKDIALYGAMRSDLTKSLRQIALGDSTLDDVLKAVSGRPAEVHHLLYKAKRPHLAEKTANLVLSQRSKREKEFGPGQHELMHIVSSGNAKDKFDVLLDVFEEKYKDFIKRKKGILLA
jgi:hypothetical protein